MRSLLTALLVLTLTCLAAEARQQTQDLVDVQVIRLDQGQLAYLRDPSRIMTLDQARDWVSLQQGLSPEERAQLAERPSTPALQLHNDPGFWGWLAEQDLSLAFTTYQSNRLFFIGRA
ncbi:hypothetical protein [Thiorhodovibrio frisius]|uniref:Uncharacterized protein n=1 Tax=Thiorhodovibrio frisius TaxID=631362 RepID=H8Z439_9GAMM|nr:hypothetical protein [Thiorhodovibrio frisius]EIC20108.1 hypothetical protein Thi970DRAFT_03725 [Thiorhodovibrio frisius]WPL20841.1 hypothetical protein Thiofri_00944 [Thiorhodovibrio frisius]